MDDKARQHMLAALIVILLILCVASSFYGFPVQRVKAAGSPPTLTSSSIYPNVGNTSDTYYFNVTYTDVDDDSPGNITVNLTKWGDNSWYSNNSMSWISGSNNTGAVFSYNTNSLGVGDYNFTICTDDGNGSANVKIIPALGAFSYSTLRNETLTTAYGFYGQGVATDGTYIFTSSKEDGNAYPGTLNNYSMTWTHQLETELGAEAAHTSDCYYKDGFVYVADFYPWTGQDYNTCYPRVVRYKASDFTYEDVVLDDSNSLVYLTEGVTFYDDYWWLISSYSATVSDKLNLTTIRKYDTDWNFVDDYIITNGSTGMADHQGLEFLEIENITYLLTTHHGGGDSGVQIYRWNGTGFIELYWYSSWDFANQGLQVNGSNNLDSVWFMNRVQGVGGAENYVLEIDFDKANDVGIGPIIGSNTAPTIVTTNATTGVTHQNATLHGYLVNDSGETCLIGFQYGETSSYGNVTLTNYTLSLEDGWNNDLTFPVEIWNYNLSIASNDTCENFCQQGGIYDDIDWIFRENGETISWYKPREINELTNIDNYQDYPEYIYNFHLLNATNLSFTYDNLDVTKNSGDTFEYNLTNLDQGQLYHYRAFATNSTGTAYGNDFTFLTKPLIPTGFSYLNDYNHATLNLSWTKGTGSNNTYIERNTSVNWSMGKGTLVYNDTANYYNDTGLTADTNYYYQLWSYTNWTYNPTIHQWSDANTSATATTSALVVDPPYNGSGSYDIGTLTVNLTWNRGNYSDREIVVQNNNTWATSPTDGWVRQNDTITFFNKSITYHTYFTVWSYNVTNNTYSTTGLNIEYGGLALNCFSENYPETAIVGWCIEISNSDFTTTYAATNLTNTHYVNMGNIPYGIDTIFLVSNSSYESRSYTYDIDQNTFYNLTFYLPLALPIDPDENETYAEDYVIHVVGPATEYGVDPPIEGAEVIIRKYINTTEQYENVGVYVTSADGTFTVPLLPNNLYSFNISATGYYATVESWMPVEIVFEGDRHHTFRLTPLSGEDIPGVDYDIFWDTITFTGVMNDIDGLNGTLTITYIDSNSSTTNTQIYIYEYWDGTYTLIATITNTSENSFTYTTGIINTTRQHTAKLFFNNTANFDVTSPVTIIINNINVWSERTPFDFEARVRSIFGDAGFSYAAVVSAGLAIMALVMFGPHNTGIGILACGFTLAFTGALFTMLFTGGFNVGLTIYTPIIIIIGAVYMLVKDPGGHL